MPRQPTGGETGVPHDPQGLLTRSQPGHNLDQVAAYAVHDINASKVVCRDAEWNEMGETDGCTLPPGKVGQCPDVIPDCWGDPGNPLAYALSIRPDGTLLDRAVATPSINRNSITWSAVAPGLSEEAGYVERNCKGLVIGRFHGAVTKRRLAEQSNRIVI